MIVSDKQVERAMDFLAQTDLEIADWRVAMLRTEYMAEVAESMVYKSIESGSVEDRKKAAKAAPEVQEKKEAHFMAVGKYEALRARRKRAELTVELWRSVNASRRAGQMT